MLESVVPEAESGHYYLSSALSGTWRREAREISLSRSSPTGENLPEVNLKGKKIEEIARMDTNTQ